MKIEGRSIEQSKGSGRGRTGGMGDTLGEWNWSNYAMRMYEYVTMNPTITHNYNTTIKTLNK